MFTVASLLCGAAQSQEMLVGARFLQGIGGAMTSAVILGMIVTMFPEPREQAKAIGIYAFVASAGGSVGLLAGGVLTQSINWHWIFFINVPVGIVTAALALRVLGRDKGIGLGAGADVPGAVLVTSALMLGVYTIVQPAAEDGWGATGTLVLGALALALLAGVRRPRGDRPHAADPAADLPLPQRHRREPDPGARHRRHVRHLLRRLALHAAGAGLLRRWRSGSRSCRSRSSWALLSVRFSEPLIMRFGARRTLLPGLALVFAGLVLFTQAPVDGDYVTDILPTMLLLGVGAGVFFPALMTIAMSSATPSDAGLASGLVNTTAQVGGALGLAVLATLSTSRSEDLLARGESAAEALTGGYHVAFWIAAGLVALAFASAWESCARRTPRRRTRT